MNVYSYRRFLWGGWVPRKRLMGRGANGKGLIARVKNEIIRCKISLYTSEAFM